MGKRLRGMAGLLGGILLVCLTVSSVDVRAQDKPARTYYESLNLSTPEDAVQTFAAAFAKEDFPTVFMVFASKTQQKWKLLLDTFNTKWMVKADYAKQVIKAIPPLDQLESWETSFIFDTIMLDAAQHDALLIDLRGDITIGTSTKLTMADGVEAVDITTTVDGIEGNVVFRLVQSPSKRWRVLQVIVQGGDESKLPWSVPSSPES